LPRAASEKLPILDEEEEADKNADFDRHQMNYLCDRTIGCTINDHEPELLDIEVIVCYSCSIS
jgi:hypothetical protein